MAITSYEKEGKTLWKVYVNLRSNENSAIRVQRRIFEIKSESAAIAEEKKLIKLLTHELLKQEGRGLEWDTVVEYWELAKRKIGEDGYSELVGGVRRIGRRGQSPKSPGSMSRKSLS
jgi:hypothetical protein